LARGADEAREALDRLGRLLSKQLTTSEKITALEAAQSALFYLGDREQALKYLELALQLEPDAGELEEQATIGVSIAMCSWMARKREKMPALLDKLGLLALQCRTDGLANLTTWTLLSSTACLHAAAGRYRESLESSLAAYDIAAKLGNEPKMGAAAINTAMSHGRMGEYRQQQIWAERALSLLRAVELQWKRYQAGYYRSLALCMLGENRKALEHLETFQDLDPNMRPTWNAQSVPLMTADIYLLAGQPAKAVRVAEAGFERTSFEPLSDGYAGMVARWVARVSVETGQVARGLELLGPLSEDLDSHDLLDQAEIVCGRLFLENRNGRSWESGRTLLRERLARLPGAVEDQLRRLEALS
jgi:tetratricopeptide (TPR) repeat protein